MPYTKIKLTAEGVVTASVTCDLETGWITAVNKSTCQQYTTSLSKYASLRSSPNLLEQHAFEIILGKVSDVLITQRLRKRMQRGVLTELLNLINDPNLKYSEPKYSWGYRDGWYVWITLSGADEPLKTLGPFGFIDEESKTERIISLASENESLFFNG